MFTSRFSSMRGRPGLGTAVSYLCLLSLLLFLAACSTQTATVAEPAEAPVPAQEAAASPLAAELDKWLREQTSDPPFRGAALVAIGDKIVLSQGYGLADTANNVPNTPDTKFSIGVLTQPITAVAIMQLHEQGLLDVNDPVCNYVDECPRPWEEINIGHLLSMTSGIPDYRDVPGYAKMKATPTTPDQLLAAVKDTGLQAVPGTRWMPGASDYIILGQIIERVSGQPYADYLQEHVFDPTGMTNSGLVPAPDGAAVGYRTIDTPADPVDPTNKYAASGVYSTVGDLFLWARALKNEKLISKSSLDEMFSKQYAIAPPDFYMGYGWAVDFPIGGHPAYGTVGGADGYSEAMMIFPENDMTVIGLLNEERDDPFDYGENLSEIVFASETQ